ncbi:MAG: hypothetical protein HY254_07895 [Burkholderiales bacterium]|nr:hypothetical protein [Burkholderiales bacterium]
MSLNKNHFLFFACANALPAADFDCVLVRPSRNTCEAALAAEGEVCFFGALVCDKALAAAVFEFAPVALLCRVLEADVAALVPVVLVFAMLRPS